MSGSGFTQLPDRITDGVTTMKTSCSFVTADVFTDQCFGGNPLAVILNAEALTAQQMQNIAREFNYSETTFVLPPAQGGDFQVRIFTPTMEVPFAGHPNIGTAVVLAQEGLLPESGQFLFEEIAGMVPVTVQGSESSGFHAELTAPEALSLGQTFAPALLAQALSLPESAIVTTHHVPQLCSVGLPFVIVELASTADLQSINANRSAIDELAALTDHPFIHAYVRSQDEFDLRTRMFAPTDGIPEDPATGSANCALAALLASLDKRADAELTYRIAQGFEMGRPSELKATVIKQHGDIQAVKIAGQAVVFSRGELFL
jgi:trans-2,3-dihydro-3-hydroxyanthranilate isomerase